MSGLWTVFRRELAAYFDSAIAYIFLIVFVILTNGLYMMQFFQIGKADMRPLFLSLPFVLNIFIPAISMRLWAEDRRGNTFELLLTFPMRAHELVLGKYLASAVFYAFALGTTLTVSVMLSMIGAPDPGHIVGGYLGSFLMGAAFLALGIFVSGLCKDQIVAFILAVVGIFVIYFFGTDFVAASVDGWLPGAGTFLKNTLGMAVRLDNFGKGIVDLGDVLYFLLVAAAFLFLNGLSLEGRLRPRAKAVFGVAVAICLTSLVLANWLLRDLPLGRFDLTHGKINTLSPVSKRILKNLKAPVQAKVYVSPPESMPTGMKTLERDVVDRLEELRVASDGKFRYKVIRLDAVSDEAGAEGRDVTLKGKGIVPFQVESVQRDEVGVKLIYSSMTLEYKEKPFELIPRLLPQLMPDLEYQMLSRIYKMTLEEKPHIAFFAPLKKEELPSELQKMMSAMGQEEERGIDDPFKTATLLVRNNGYRVTRIAIEEADGIPGDATTLVVLDPGKLNDRQLFEINRYLYRGGTVVIGAEPREFTYNHTETGVQALSENKALDVNRFLEKLGVKIDDKVLLDESSQVISLNTGQTIGPFAVEMPVKLPNQIIIEDASMNRNAALTQRLPSLLYLWGTALELADGVIEKAGLKKTVLFTSSERSWKLPADTGVLNPKNTAPPSGKSEGKYPLAVLLEGQFPDTFHSPAPKWKEDGQEGARMDSPKPGRLLVVGSSKMFTEDLIRSGGNLGFYANVIDGLTLGENLVEIRSKGDILRNIRRLSSGEKIWYRFLSVLLVPMVLAAAAALRLFLRRKEKDLYLSAQGRTETA